MLFIFQILQQSRSRQFNGRKSTETQNCIHNDCLPEKYPSYIDIWPRSLVAFGDWHGPKYCTYKSDLATGFKFGWEPSQGKGDDTSGNGFWLHCNGIEDNPQGRSNVIGWSGDFSERFHTASCNKGDYLYGIQVRSEPYQGSSGDDTTLNNVRLWCRNHQSGETYQLSEPKATTWGRWTDRVNCPKYYGMFGIKLRIEAWESDNDDTSLGQIVPYCKPITVFADVAIDSRR